MSDRIAKERLYRTVDDRVVFEGDPDAAFLLAPVGKEIPEGYEVPTKAVKAVKALPKKAAAKAPNKAVKGAPNKGA